MVAPGADPELIALRLDGADRLTLDASGDLLVAHDGTELRIHRPVAYQEVDGRRVPVEAALRVSGDRVGFVLGVWDRARPLVIDPVVSYATYIGGAGGRPCHGRGSRPRRECVHHRHDGCRHLRHEAVADGRTILYQTLLLSDSSLGTSISAAAITVDATGSAYVAGGVIADEFSGSRFPVTANALQSLRRQLRWVRPVPGRRVCRQARAGWDARIRLVPRRAMRRQRHWHRTRWRGAFVAGYTDEPTSFPTRGTQYATPGRGNPFAFVAKMAANFSSYIYSTLLRGTATASRFPATQMAGALAVDAAGNAHIAGDTDAVDFPTTACVPPSTRGRRRHVRHQALARRSQPSVLDVPRREGVPHSMALTRRRCLRASPLIPAFPRRAAPSASFWICWRCR